MIGFQSSTSQYLPWDALVVLNRLLRETNSEQSLPAVSRSWRGALDHYSQVTWVTRRIAIQAYSSQLGQLTSLEKVFGK